MALSLVDKDTGERISKRLSGESLGFGAKSEGQELSIVDVNAVSTVVEVGSDEGNHLLFSLRKTRWIRHDFAVKKNEGAEHLAVVLAYVFKNVGEG